MEDIDWAGLETDITADNRFAPPTRESKGPTAKNQRFPCFTCGGSGKYHGVRLHQQESKCFACGGKGYFLTSEQDRRNARQKAHARKANKLAETRAAFDEQYPDITPALIDAGRWSPFAVDLHNKLSIHGSLSEKQVATIRSMVAKVAERRAARAAEREAAKQIVDLAPIRAMFETARANGHKKPIYRAAGLEISRAPDHGKNPSALYVKSLGNEANGWDEEYLGKILGIEYTGKPAPGLVAIADDPRGEAVRYGQRTGSCSCCGRELSDPKSIAAGIGPICAERWGL